ncbi:MAG: hypothetical protein IAE66_00345 [Xanthomonadaceae bacterium]|nr:hypothetical protein [Xanthomonadaceae bacterium]
MALLLPAFLLLAGCTTTQVRTAEGPQGKPIQLGGSVVMITPDIELSEVGAGGVAEPRKAWTETARQLYPEAARQRLTAQGVRLQPDFVIPPDMPPERRVRQLELLNQAVSISILQYGGSNSRLRNKHGKFDWSLGPGMIELQRITGADYALFTYLRDSYSSGGRVAMRVLGAVLLGGDIGGGTQVGLASLVDLRTGQVVWHNLLVDQTGDLRTPAGASETAGDLLKDFPK